MVAKIKGRVKEEEVIEEFKEEDSSGDGECLVDKRSPPINAPVLVPPSRKGKIVSRSFAEGEGKTESRSVIER